MPCPEMGKGNHFFPHIRHSHKKIKKILTSFSWWEERDENLGVSKAQQTPAGTISYGSEKRLSSWEMWPSFHYVLTCSALRSEWGFRISGSRKSKRGKGWKLTPDQKLTHWLERETEKNERNKYFGWESLFRLHNSNGPHFPVRVMYCPVQWMTANSNTTDFLWKGDTWRLSVLLVTIRYEKR